MCHLEDYKIDWDHMKSMIDEALLREPAPDFDGPIVHADIGSTTENGE